MMYSVRMAKRGAARVPAALLVAVSTILTLLAAEAACRWLFQRNVDALRFAASDLYYYYDRDGYRRNLPGRVGYERLWNDKGKAEFKINALGFRGDEVVLPKPTGVHRILFLGDSITLGGRLDEADTFVARVRRGLAGGKGRYDVLNAGVGDVGLREEERTLEGPGLAAQPDLVVLCWYLNDARPPVGFPEEVVYGNPLIRWFDSKPLLRKSYLAGFLYDALRKSLVARRMAVDHRFDYGPLYQSGAWDSDPNQFGALVRLARFDWGDAWSDESLAWMARRIVALRERAAKSGAKFVVVALPVHAQVYAKFSSPLVDKPQRELAAALAAEGVPFLDLLPPLRARARAAREPVFYDQCHYTPYGNGLVAEAVLAFLRR